MYCDVRCEDVIDLVCLLSKAAHPHKKESWVWDSFVHAFHSYTHFIRTHIKVHTYRYIQVHTGYRYIQVRPYSKRQQEVKRILYIAGAHDRRSV